MSEPITFKLGVVLSEPGDKLEHAYFPTTATFSIIYASVEQQLCRWVLMSHNPLDSDNLVMTHDLIQSMLGVRREGITLAAKKLADKKLIKNSCRTIVLLDRLGLEKNVCECYKVVNIEYDPLLSRGISRTFR